MRPGVCGKRRVVHNESGRCCCGRDRLFGSLSAPGVGSGCTEESCRQDVGLEPCKQLDAVYCNRGVDRAGPDRSTARGARSAAAGAAGGGAVRHARPESPGFKTGAGDAMEPLHAAGVLRDPCMRGGFGDAGVSEGRSAHLQHRAAGRSASPRGRCVAPAHVDISACCTCR